MVTATVIWSRRLRLTRVFPWTAVNLVDYYVVQRGHYAIAEIFKPRRSMSQK